MYDCFFKGGRGANLKHYVFPVKKLVGVGVITRVTETHVSYYRKLVVIATRMMATTVEDTPA